MSTSHPVSRSFSSFISQNRVSLERTALCLTGIVVATMAIANPVAHPSVPAKEIKPRTTASATPIPQVVVTAKRWNEVQKAHYDAAQAALLAKAK